MTSDGFDLRRLTRRQFVMATAGLSLAHWPRQVSSQPRFQTNPFSLGVASGAPSSTSLVLWTRLAPSPLEGGGMPPEDVRVRYRVATDARMSHVVIDETVAAMPELAHSLHPIAVGLKPATDYWYQFSAGNEESPIGHSRTLPAPSSRPARVDFAYTSCQHYEQGYYLPYRFMAEDDLDLIVHLGDYIYENKTSPLAEGRIVRQHDSDEVFSLAGYRNRYALYKSDPHLQSAHAACAWLTSWDDHEVNNNWASAYPQDPHRQTPTEFLVRKLAAIQAYYEHMPLRHFPVAAGGGLDLRLYGRYPFGSLAQFHLLDTRQYRSDQVCTTGDYINLDCTERHAPERTMLGTRQREWLVSGLEPFAGGWNVIAQQVWFGRYTFTGGSAPEHNRDAWDGYPQERQRVVDAVASRAPGSSVVLAGDWHNFCVRDIHENPDVPEGGVVMTELAGTSLSSRTSRTAQIQASLADNPQVRFFDGDHRGYVRCRIERDVFRADLQFLSSPFTPVDATMRTGASFVVERGRPGALRA